MSEGYFLKSLISSDWTNQNEDADWFIGMILGTDDFLTKEEKDSLTEKCEQLIIDHLDGIDATRMSQMQKKARVLNPTFKKAFPRARLMPYDDNIILKRSSVISDAESASASASAKAANTDTNTIEELLGVKLPKKIETRNDDLNYKIKRI